MPASVLEVLITGDATSLKTAYVQATASTEEFAAATASSSAATQEAAASAQRFGQTTARAFQIAKLGAAAFAAISIKNAIDFNREFTLIAAITNTAADRIDSLKGTVMSLSTETAQSPTDLAHALYFLASAGLTTTQQMQALDASAHGAAVGLGSTQDLARITANALNAFGDQGLTATQVMDTLTAAIREGTAEPDEFATALGRVLPIADSAGISFQQVAASLATMSNAGLDVNEGVTALRAMLQSLVAPTAQTEKAFGQMGLTVTDVVDSMRGQGLIATLRLVSDAAKKSTDSTGEYNQMMRHAIPNIRGLAGALNLTHQQAAKVDEIFKQITQSAGDLNTAFQTTAQSDAFKVKQSFQEIMNVGQQLAADILPALAAGLKFGADNATTLLEVFGAFAAVKWLIPFIRGVAAANTDLAASEIAAGQAAVVQAAEMQAAAVQSAKTGSVPGLVRFPVMGASSSVAANTLQTELSGGAANASKSFAEMGFQVSGASTAISRLGNTIGSSGLPQIFALVQGVRDASNELAAFKERGLAGAIQSVIGSSTVSNLANFFPGGGAITSFFKSLQGPDVEAITHLYDGLQSVKSAFADLGISAKDQAAITQKALADIGASSLADVTTANIDQYVTAVQTEIDVTQQQKQADEQAKAAALELQKQIQANNEANKSWQKSTAEMTDHLSGLSRVGINVSDFMSQLQNDLASSDDQAKTFGDAIDTVTQAWTDFKTQAQQALFFIPQALSDVTSAATQAQDQLANLSSNTTMSNSELATLRDTANLTGQDILKAFQDANKQSRQFFENLKEIASHGKFGKDLAASLLQSGNTMAAATIAGSQFEGQILKTFGAGEKMSENFATTLTDSIVGPLNKITSILRQLAVKAFGIDLNLNDQNAKKGMQERKKQAEQLAHQNYKVQLGLQDDASKGIHGVQGDVDHLVGNVHKVQLGVNSDLARTQLANFDSTLDTFLSKKRQINIGVHTHPSSPWPDEALKQHLVDPMKTAGFRKVGDAWTLPLNVGTHTDPSTFPGGSAPKDAKDAQRKSVAGLGDLKKVEMRQLQVLFDIRQELRRGVGGGSGSGGSSSGSSSSGSSGSSSSGISSDFNKNLTQQLRDMRLYVSSVQGKKAANKWASAIQQAIQNGNMAREMSLLHQAMRDMADTTGQKEAEKAFHEFQGSVQQFEKMQHQAQFKQFMADALAYATHNVPRLPKGHTNISVNHHEHHRRREVTLDRKRFTQSAGYEVDYARGF